MCVRVRVWVVEVWGVCVGVQGGDATACAGRGQRVASGGGLLVGVGVQLRGGHCDGGGGGAAHTRAVRVRAACVLLLLLLLALQL